MKPALPPIVFLLLLAGSLCLSGSPEDAGSYSYNISLVLDSSRYRPGDEATLTIINGGDKTLLVGPDYELYRLENEGWERVNTGLTFTMIGYEIAPGSSWSQTVRLVVVKGEGTIRTIEPLPPGRYRIAKTVMIENTQGREGELTLSAEFEIVG